MNGNIVHKLDLFYCNYLLILFGEISGVNCVIDTGRKNVLCR
jgi:hypothetical protein